jgi:CheY-like chemotaxis protein/signal transduction histidine kinase
MRADNDRSTNIAIAIAILMAGVLVLDYSTPLGIVSWILYVLPMGLCLFMQRTWAPIVVGAAASALIMLGFFLSPPGVETELGVINRLIGVVTVWIVAVIVRQVLIVRRRVEHYTWLSEGQAQVSRSAIGDLPGDQMASAQLAALAEYVDARVGVMYRIDGDMIVRSAQYALDRDAPEKISRGEGAVGQVAKGGKAIVLSDVPPDYLRVSSALGGTQAQGVIVSPLTTEGRPYGVLELGFMRRLEPADRALELLDRLAEPVGVSLRSALYRQRVQELLEETQRQSEELQVQQEELKTSNEELEEQSHALRESQARLENQQAELEQTNAQLEARTNDLERQKQELLRVQDALSDTARRLELASRYKSEFLANMSHELRTPLNSSLILSKMLADNASGNLTEEQVNYARVIQSSNNDLLALINDILDLSKIEAGRVELEIEPVELAHVLENLRSTVGPVAAEKNLELRMEMSAHAPATVTTDARRLEQVLRNLMSNAIKFTHAGSVELRIAPAPGGKVAFVVEDTGIGIPEEEHATIFEAFHQADGTSSRRYGGSGLGLSISRELAALLGGTIEVQSTVGVGSIFTLTVAAALDAAQTTASSSAPAAAPPQRTAPAAQGAPTTPRSIAPPSPQPRREETLPHIDDDRSRRERERVILVVEDDPNFARIVYGVAHDLDLDCVHSSSGAEALKLARELRPCGILLDVGLPDDSGLAVLERLKRDPVTRHIPVHMISVEDHTQPALELGAIGYTLKPTAREQLERAVQSLKERVADRPRRILIVEDDEPLRTSIAVLLQAGDIEIEVAGTAREALEKLASTAFDIIVMDLALPDATGYSLLERIGSGEKYAGPPVIVYTGRTLTEEDERRLRRYSRSIIIKGARSPERLLDEVTLFLHRVEAGLPPDQQRLLRQARQRDAAFDGRTILLAEDDVRNIYALSSVLEPLGARVEIARNGREALERLNGSKHIDLVLMDIMMPEMDGLTAIREIRKSPHAARLPIIAITAKAMPEDRRACLEAGANDYAAKPIDIDRLLSLCRVWMPK